MEEEQRIKGFGLIGIIIVAAVITVFAGGGLYWRELQQQKLLQQRSAETGKKIEELKSRNEQQPLTNEIDTSSSPVVSNVEGWKTYRNEEYGFEMRYPLEWEDGYDNPDAAQRAEFTHINLVSDSAYSISIQVTMSGDIIGLAYNVCDADISKIALKRFPSGHYEIILLNGIPAVRHYDGGITVFHCQPNFEVSINEMTKVAEYGNYKPIEPNVLQQIISSFKFVK